jgi:hypothetical protein
MLGEWIPYTIYGILSEAVSDSPEAFSPGWVCQSMLIVLGRNVKVQRF